jgi:hypothetical protein
VHEGGFIVDVGGHQVGVQRVPGPQLACMLEAHAQAHAGQVLQAAALQRSGRPGADRGTRSSSRLRPDTSHRPWSPAATVHQPDAGTGHVGQPGQGRVRRGGQGPPVIARQRAAVDREGQVEPGVARRAAVVTVGPRGCWRAQSSRACPHCSAVIGSMSNTVKRLFSRMRVRSRLMPPASKSICCSSMSCPPSGACSRVRGVSRVMAGVASRH